MDVLSLPADMPDALRDLVALSEPLDGETIVFRADDRIAFASPAAAHRYPFLDLGDASYETLYWSTLQHGLTSPDAMRMDATAYLAMAQNARRTNDALDFQKAYGATRLLCHHRRLPDGWSAQVRVTLTSPRLRGVVDTNQPINLLQAMQHAQNATRLRVALDHLPVGVLFVAATGRIVWCNAAATDALREARAISDDGGRLRLTDLIARTAFAVALAGVLAGQRQQYVACPDGDRTRLLSVSRAALPEEALVLLAPVDAPDGSVIEALSALGLSPAEAQIAFAVGAGDGPAAVAEATGKQVSTVRRQLATVYEKLSPTRVTSQRALARLVSQVAAIAGRSRRLFH